MVLMALLATATLLLNTKSVQNMLLSQAFVRLFKPKKGEAGTVNYQFLIDAFKHSKDSTARADSTAKQRHKLKLDAGDLRLKNISVSYNTATFHLLDAHYNKQESRLTIDSLRWCTDNHLPRKNTGKPHRGFFDVGHLDMTLSMEWAISQLSADSVKATLKRCTARLQNYCFYVSAFI